MRNRDCLFIGVSLLSAICSETASGHGLSGPAFVVTRAADAPASSSPPTLAAKPQQAAANVFAASSSVPLYSGSTGVLSVGNLKVTLGGSSTCYDASFATNSTSPKVTLSLASATAVSCPASSNSSFDGSTLSLSKMVLTLGNSSSCFDVTLTGSAASNYVFTVASATATTCTAATSSIDPTKLPIGDSKMTTTTPAVGFLYTCTAGSPTGGGATAKGPWFNADGTTWNSTTKFVVSGSVSWTSTFMASLSGSILSINGNGLPNHKTGTFPIPTSDAIHQYDGNPNSISAQTIAASLPANPQIASKPSCLPGGAIAVLLTGSRVFNASDAVGRDAAAWEGQDSCQGHPERTGAYHYHTLTTCATPADSSGQHSPLVGYAADGFGLYGNQGEGGVALTNTDLDLCHGHTHSITVNGATVTQYHYHATKEFPYTLGCFKGTPVTLR